MLNAKYVLQPKLLNPDNHEDPRRCAQNYDASYENAEFLLKSISSIASELMGFEPDEYQDVHVAVWGGKAKYKSHDFLQEGRRITIKKQDEPSKGIKPNPLEITVIGDNKMVTSFEKQIHSYSDVFEFVEGAQTTGFLRLPTISEYDALNNPHLRVSQHSLIGPSGWFTGNPICGVVRDSKRPPYLVIARSPVFNGDMGVIGNLGYFHELPLNMLENYLAVKSFEVQE